MRLGLSTHKLEILRGRGDCAIPKAENSEGSMTGTTTQPKMHVRKFINPKSSKTPKALGVVTRSRNMVAYLLIGLARGLCGVPFLRA